MILSPLSSGHGSGMKCVILVACPGWRRSWRRLRAGKSSQRNPSGGSFFFSKGAGRHQGTERSQETNAYLLY